MDKPKEWPYAHLAPYPGGWVAYSYGPDLEDWVLARLESGDHGRLHVAELHVSSSSRVSSDLLRRIPLGSLEAMANAPAAAKMIRPTLDVPGAEPAAVQRPGGATYPTPTVLSLNVPKGRKSEGFYERVAEVYTSLAQRSRRPAADIAEACDTPVVTVHRWVAEARKRGYLPPAERGRRG
jgi:hypothetical protein